jgi:tetratricopeptide (TPR) repeat protein
MKLLFLSISLLIFFSAKAQEGPCDYLEKAISHYQNRNIDSALNLMTYVVENMPDTSVCYGRCFNNIPLAYASLGQFDEAKIWFNKILQSSLNDKAPGTDIMEPYANFHHNACMKLVQVNQTLKDYSQALKYLDSAETTYSFKTFSGTGFEKRAVSIAMWKSRLYLEMSLKDSAIYVLLLKTLDTDVRFRKSDFETLSNVDFYSPVNEKLVELIGTDHLKAEQSLIKKAIKNLTITKQGQQTIGTFTFHNLDYHIGLSTDKSKKEVIEKLLNNPFFG